MNELLLDKHLLFSFVFGFYLLIILFIVIYVYSWLVFCVSFVYDNSIKV